MKIKVTLGILFIIVIGALFITKMNSNTPDEKSESVACVLAFAKATDGLGDIHAKDGVIAFSCGTNNFKMLVTQDNADSKIALFFLERPVKNFLSINTSFDLETSPKALTAEFYTIANIIKPIRDDIMENSKNQVSFFMIDNDHLSNVPASSENIIKVSEGKPGVLAVASALNSATARGDGKMVSPAAYYRMIITTLLDKRWIQ